VEVEAARGWAAVAESARAHSGANLAQLLAKVDNLEHEISRLKGWEASLLDDIGMLESRGDTLVRERDNALTANKNLERILMEIEDWSTRELSLATEARWAIKLVLDALRQVGEKVVREIPGVGAATEPLLECLGRVPKRVLSFN
jgi:septal ring factor EnvC (AmiA/AmiB activator)